MPDSALKRLAQMRNPGNWLVASLEGAQAYEGPSHYDKGWFHPSSLGEECDARLAFQFLDAPGVDIISAQTRRIFDNGSGRDLWLKLDSKRSGISLIEEFEERPCESCGLPIKDNRHICLPDLRIRGELDEWVENPVNKRKFVVDFKTMRSGLFNELAAPLDHHVIQLHPYMMGKTTYDGFVLYENKDTQEFKSMSVFFDNNLWIEKIVVRLERILTELRRFHVNRNPKSCTNCPFFKNGVCSANKIQKLLEESELQI